MNTCLPAINGPQTYTTCHRDNRFSFISVFCALSLFLLLSLQSFADASEVSEPTKTTITIGIVANNEPYSSTENHMPKGFSVDVLNRISDITQLNFEYRVGSWSNIYAAFLRGDLDVIDEISWREDRAETILFTDPYHIRQTAVMHHAANPLPKVSFVKDLKGYRVGVLRDIYYRDFLVNEGVEVIEYDLQTDLVQALSFGWVDVIVGAEVTLTYLAKKEGFLQMTKNAVIPLNGMESEDFRLGVLKSRPELHQKLQQALQSLPEDWLNGLSERWMEYGGQSPMRPHQLKLKPEQTRYLKRLPPLRIGMMRDYAPFSFSENGMIQGLSVDITYRLQDIIGVEFIPVVDQWSNLYTLFKQGDLDLIANISDLPERREYTLFTQPYHRIPNVIYTRDKQLRVKKPSDLSGLRIALGEDVFYEDAVRGLFKDQVFSYSEQSLMFKALAENQVDVVLAALPNGNHLIRELGLTDIRIAGELQLPGLAGEDLRLGLQPELEPLRDILDQALNTLSQTEKRTIENRWLGTGSQSSHDTPINLNQQEKELLLSWNGRLTYCIHPDRYPLEQLNGQGQHEGMSASLLTLFQSKMDTLGFDLYPTDSWQESLQALKRGDCALIPMMNHSQKLQQDYLLTAPWYNASNVILGNLDAPFISRLSQLGNQPVGIAKDNGLAGLLQQQYPQLNLVEVEDTLSGIQLLRQRKLYGFIGGLAHTSYLLQKESLGDVRVLGRLPLDSNFSIAINRQYPQLLELMSKLLQSLSPQDLGQIEKDWLSIKLEQHANYRLLWQLSGGFALLFFALFYWNRKLGSLNNQLKSANEKLAYLSITDQLTELGNRNYLNQTFDLYREDCRQKSACMALALIDADLFKQVNDNFGHDTGDICLQSLANQMRLIFNQPRDHLIRFGGEEFIVLTSDSSADNINRRLQQLRQAVAGHSISTDDASLSITISIGCLIAIPDQNTTLNHWLKSADKALYEAKNQGRNRVINYPG